MARILSRREIQIRLHDAHERFEGMSDSEFCSNLELLKVRPLMFNHIERRAILEVAIAKIGKSIPDLEKSRKTNT